MQIKEARRLRAELESALSRAAPHHHHSTDMSFPNTLALAILLTTMMTRNDDYDDFEAHLCLEIVPRRILSRCRQNFSLQEAPLSQMTLMWIITITMMILIRIWIGYHEDDDDDHDHDEEDEEEEEEEEVHYDGGVGGSMGGVNLDGKN